MSLDRRAAVAELLRDRSDLVVVAGLGSSAYDVAAAGESSLDFPLWGGMGGAAMVGLGLALTQPNRPVLVLTGDGEMLMGLGSLATIGSQAPANLSIVVLDNERYGETGQQRTATSMGVDLAATAAACGFASTSVVRDASAIPGLRGDIHAAAGPLFAVIKISSDEVQRAFPPRDGAFLTHRMRGALLGEQRALEA